NMELEWIGKYFGYGFDFNKNEEVLERQRQIKDKYQGSYEGEDHDDDDEEWKEFYDEHDEPSVRDPKRVSRLKAFLISKDSIELGNLDEDIYEQFMKSGFRLDLVSDELDEMDDELGN
ncbi:hypothetical protein BGZ99_007321, partial [Dissophora globulifera]